MSEQQTQKRHAIPFILQFQHNLKLVDRSGMCNIYLSTCISLCPSVLSASSPTMPLRPFQPADETMHCSSEALTLALGAPMLFFTTHLLSHHFFLTSFRSSDLTELKASLTCCYFIYFICWSYHQQSLQTKQLSSFEPHQQSFHRFCFFLCHPSHNHF